jgi:pilus assembly protein CpaE
MERVCVIDLDFSMGDVSAFLDLQSNNSIQDVLRNLSRLDERMLAGSVVVHPSKVHVLAQPKEIADKDEVKGEEVLQVLTAASDAYRYVIVDCGGRIDEATLMATSVADVVLLICTPSVVSVKNAWRRLQLMDRLTIERSSVRLIVNQWGKTAELTLKDIESNLGIQVAATISADPVTCNKAVNVGKLLRDVDRRSPTVRDISAAIPLVTERAQRIEPSAGPSLISRLFG